MLQYVYYILLICGAIQVIKLLFEFFALIINTKTPANSNNGEPVSVIVCAKNEKDKLPKLIERLLEQSHPDVEIIIVDDRSTDGSYDLLMSYDDQIKHVRIDQTPDHINNKKYAVTLGVRAASHDHLLFIDADCYPNGPNWISSMMNKYQSSFVLGFSQYIKEKGFLNGFIRYETLISGIQFLSFAKIGNPYMGVGRNMGYRKQMFIEKKGFNGYNHIVGGDDDLFVNKHANRKNTKTNMSPEGLVYSFPEKTFKTFFRQKKRHLSASKHYKTKDKLLLGIISLSNIFFWIALIALITINFPLKILAVMYFSRLFLIIINAQLASLRFGDRISLLLIPIYDFTYTVYLIIVGTTAMLAKKITWT